MSSLFVYKSDTRQACLVFICHSLPSSHSSLLLSLLLYSPHDFLSTCLPMLVYILLLSIFLQSNLPPAYLSHQAIPEPQKWSQLKPSSHTGNCPYCFYTWSVQSRAVHSCSVLLFYCLSLWLYLSQSSLTNAVYVSYNLKSYINFTIVRTKPVGLHVLVLLLQSTYFKLQLTILYTTMLLFGCGVFRQPQCGITWNKSEGCWVVQVAWSLKTILFKIKGS